MGANFGILLGLPAEGELTLALGLAVKAIGYLGFYCFLIVLQPHLA